MEKTKCFTGICRVYVGKNKKSLGSSEDATVTVSEMEALQPGLLTMTNGGIVWGEFTHYFSCPGLTLGDSDLIGW